MHQKTIISKPNVLLFIKFTFFSLGAGIIQIVTFTLLNEIAGFLYWPSYLIALILSIVFNFTINRKFTFKSAVNIPIAMLKVFGFYCVFTPLSTWWGQALSDIHVNDYFILIGTMIINLLTEFLFTRYVVYKNSVNTRKR